GIGGGGSMIASSREEWEKTFNVCWGGVYHSTRTFLPMLQRADEGHIVNTSSVNGFWASIGPRIPDTAYCAAKFAVKGFTRASIASMGTDVSSLSDEGIQTMVAERERRFREEAPMTAAEAATVILDGVKAGRWRILVGEDARRIDGLVRQSPEHAYDVDFFE